jgi:hypothetical protein
MRCSSTSTSVCVVSGMSPGRSPWAGPLRPGRAAQPGDGGAGVTAARITYGSGDEAPAKPLTLTV